MFHPRRSLALLAVATFLFGLAIALREDLNPWWSNAGIAIFAMVGYWRLSRPSAKALLEADVGGIAFAALLGVGLVVATHLVYDAAVDVVPELGRTVEAHYSVIDTQAPQTWLTVILILVVVVAEELLWRGIAQSFFAERLGEKRAIAIAVGLYALPQLIGGSWILLAAALGLGAIFSLQRNLSRALWNATVTHGIWSASVFCLFPLT